MVVYRYDAWGRVISTTSSLAVTLGKHNPFRYRGYIYDRETGLYYLRSRSYNLTVGRFMNADTLLEIHGELLSANIYSYCENSSIA